MIKACELRVKNIITDYHGIIREVTGEDIRDQWWFESEPKDGSLEAPLNPIPLTPEWLMTHVAKYEAPYYMLMDRIGVAANYYRDASGNYDGFLLCYKIGLEMKSLLDVPVIRYLHQLQNLYFALTGEELQIKIP